MAPPGLSYITKFVDYIGDKLVNDNCDYESNGDGPRESNRAIIWQNAQPGEWYNCSSAPPHSAA